MKFPVSSWGRSAACCRVPGEGLGERTLHLSWFRRVSPTLIVLCVQNWKDSNCSGPGWAAIWTARSSSRAHKVKLHENSTGRRPGKVQFYVRVRSRGVTERWILLKLQTTDLGLLSSPEDLFLTLTSSQCQLGSAQPHQEPVWGHFGKDMAAFTQKWEPQIHVFCSADLPLSVFTSRYCMCSILQGMLGKIYYANVYSVACFALPLLLVAFKEKKKVLLFLWSESFKKENADCMLLVSSFLWICFMGFRCTKTNCITITFLQ